MNYYDIIQFIREQIQKKGIYQRDLAEKLYITESALSLYLNHKRRMPLAYIELCLDYFGYALAIRSK